MQFNLSTLLILATAIASINASPLPAEGQPIPEPADILAPRSAEALPRIRPISFGRKGGLARQGGWTSSTGDHSKEEEEEEGELHKRALPVWRTLKLAADLKSADGDLSSPLKKVVKSGIRKGIKKGMRKGLKELAEEILFKRDTPTTPKKFDGFEFDTEFTAELKSKFKKGAKKGVRKGVRKGASYGVKKGIKKGAKKALKKGAKKALKKGIKKGLKCYFIRFLC